MKMNKFFQKILSNQIDISNVKTVCLALGPYRNLTTLTSSILALHPTCQVLNHASDRILDDKHLNFLLNYNQSKFDAFTKYAIYISGGGKRGRYGGSITLSHAFDYDNIREAYQARYGKSLIKERIECLFWKEPLRTSNFIKQNQVDLGAIFNKNDKLRFLMPIRNPLDCAISNLKTGHVKFFLGLNQQSSLEEVLAGILKELLWFLKLHTDYPERFFYYFENGSEDQVLLALANFLGIEPDSEWLKSSLANFKVKASYQYDSHIVGYYNDLVKENFSVYPKVLEKLSLFTQY